MCIPAGGGGKICKSKSVGGSDQIEETRYPFDEILQNSASVSAKKKSQNDFSLTFFIFEFFWKYFGIGLRPDAITTDVWR